MGMDNQHLYRFQVYKSHAEKMAYIKLVNANHCGASLHEQLHRISAVDIGDECTV